MKNCLYNQPLLPIKFEQSSTLKEGTKRLSPVVHSPTRVPLWSGCILPSRRSWPPATGEINQIENRNMVVEKTNDIKNWFFDQVNETEKLSGRLTKKNERRLKLLNQEREKGHYWHYRNKKCYKKFYTKCIPIKTAYQQFA